ncbi:M14 family metallopeptidase [Actinomadura alba]|uniref:Chitobiase/beta-hexosaminidase C-terminal domain-containing protein n=1 Tax=Actinomadura alba TaxID=406431 RepID=A0ABR7LNK8_9ACTN|nr:M14 family metallopeptidase [Actinomadura alba]MBC6466416.1 chitobiase/beta-hexosaminidase C-terminal domain-containing protein [Actinomadura alba]
MRLTRKPAWPKGRATWLALPLALVLTPAMLASSSVASQSSNVPAERRSTYEQNGVALMRVIVPDQAGIDRLEQLGVDLAEYSRPADGGVEVHAILSPQESKDLRDKGVDVRDAIADQTDVTQLRQERSQKLSTLAQQAQGADTLTPMRAEWFTSLPDDQKFLSVEVKTSDTAATNILTATWDSGPGTAPGSGGTATMSRFTDAGQYMYHRFNTPLPLTSAPSKLEITSTSGGSITVPVTKWLGEPRKKPSPHYVSDFVDHYMDPTELYQRIGSLAKQFPKLTQLVDLPNKTNGYRRAAQAQFGTAATSTLYVSSKAYGSEGGNGISVALTDPGTAGAPLTVEVSGKAVVVKLATNSSGAVTSTAAQVVSALNGNAGAAGLLSASTYRGDAGAGVVAAAPATALTDSLQAPATVARQPFTMQALRIGKNRDGSKPGVFLYCQEHAREWVTPLTCVETAERLLRNYSRDATTRKLVDGLDIFVLPSVNPDGGHYSMYDFNMQRRNMTNHCGPADADPARRNSWGVDLNRNFSVGSAFDGYTGASTTNCRSDTFAGPSELSEPEAKNEVWITQKYPNIKFAMNTHSYGGYFMWPPGAYKSAGRELLPYADLGTETYFWAASDHILNEVQKWRGTAIWPGRTGPVTDVLYSAAGNSADEHWYSRGIIGWDFEVGADIYDPATKRFNAVGFQPGFAEGHQEAMEFANGQIGILEVALAYSQDKKTPKSELSVTARDAGATKFTITVNEPATVYYTLDGSRPTLRSPKLKMAGMREGSETITVDRTTEVKWFSVDIAGNVESRYKPDGRDNDYRREIVQVR